eukprot:m.55402 g.55402  ORF g.55402 m.55402 type:complete len:153 (+) comp34470_c0_seq6:692-1150(+)
MVMLTCTQQIIADVCEILDLRAFDPHRTDVRVHTANHGHLWHSPSIGTVTVETEREIDEKSLEKWLQTLLWDMAVENSKGKVVEILRLKGVIAAKNATSRLVLQSVRETFETVWTTPWKQGETRKTCIVFIGKNVEEGALRSSFMEFCAIAQ